MDNFLRPAEALAKGACKQKILQFLQDFLLLVSPRGIEPLSRTPQARILSVELWRRVLSRHTYLKTSGCVKSNLILWEIKGDGICIN